MYVFVVATWFGFFYDSLFFLASFISNYN